MLSIIEPSNDTKSTFFDLASQAVRETEEKSRRLLVSFYTQEGDTKLLMWTCLPRAKPVVRRDSLMMMISQAWHYSSDSDW